MSFGIDDAIAAGLKILDKFIADPEAKAKAESELRSALLAWDQGQIEVNKVEAASSNIFVAGWRPAVGWVCSAAFAYHFVLQPLLAFIFTVGGKTLSLPEFDMASLMTVLMGLLGMAGLRTYEKTRNGK